MCSIFAQAPRLHDVLNLNCEDFCQLEADIHLHHSALYRSLGASHRSFASIAYLAEIAGRSKEHGVDPEFATQYELSHVLWDVKEAEPSIQILRKLKSDKDGSNYAFPVGRVELLTTLVSRFIDSELRFDISRDTEYQMPASKLQRTSSRGTCGLLWMV